MVLARNPLNLPGLTMPHIRRFDCSIVREEEKFAVSDYIPQQALILQRVADLQKSQDERL